MSDKSYVFYGMGKHLLANFDEWEKQFRPKCIVERNPDKWGGYKGIPVCSLEEAESKWAGSMVCITAPLNFFYEIQDRLMNAGIDKERITSPQHRDSKPHYCRSMLLRDVTISRAAMPIFSLCCGSQHLNGEIDAENDSIAEIINKARTLGKRVFDDLKRGAPSPCDGCSELREGTLEEVPALKSITFGSGIKGATKCNFQCCYCCAEPVIHLKGEKACGENEKTVLDYFREIEQHFAGQTISVNYLAAELAASPFCNEMLAIWERNGWDGHIASNCSIYSESIARLLESGRVFLDCSLDAGTPETFARVKGVDCFERVKENLRCYAKASRREKPIVLKYIILEGKNTNEADVRGFAEFANELGDKVRVSISRDFDAMLWPMSDVERKTFDLLIELFRNRETRYSVADYNFNQSDAEYLGRA